MRNLIRSQAIYLGIFLCLLSLHACGASQRTKTLQASILAVNSARDGFHEYDRAHEHDLVEHSNTRAEAEAAVAAYRAQSSVIYAAFEVTYRGLAVAATQTDDLSLRAAITTVAQLMESIKKLTGGP